MLLFDLAENTLCIRVVTVLLHFMWQGAAIAACAAVASVALRRASSRVRYGVLVTLFGVMAVCPVVTFFLVSPQPLPQTPEPTPLAIAPVLELPEPLPAVREPEPPAEPVLAMTVPDAEVSGEVVEETVVLNEGVVEAESMAAVELEPLPAPTVAATDTTEPLAPPAARALVPAEVAAWIDRIDLRPYATHLTAAYLLGVALMLARLAIALRGGRRLRRHAEPVTDACIIDPLVREAKALGLAFAPAIAYCTRVTVPTIVGVMRPMILLPTAFVTGLTPDQVGHILRHELAHLRRYDHIVNVVQGVVEALLFFHPAVWYLSRKIRIEREHCCDDLALSAGGEAMAYAESLVQVAELSKGVVGATAGLRATGRPSQLRRRILRLLEGPRPHVRLSRAGVAVLAVVALLGVTAAVQVTSAGQADVAETTEAMNYADLDAPVEEPEPPKPLTQEEWGVIRGQLSSEDWWLRQAAAQELGATRDKEFTYALTSLLNDPDPRVVVAAAKALGQIGDPKAARYLVATLKGIDKSEGESGPNRGVRPSNFTIMAAAADALAQIGGPEVMKYLRMGMRDDDVLMRRGAIKALGQIGSDEAMALVLSAGVGAQDDWVVVAVGEALGDVPAKLAVPALKRALDGADSGLARAAAIGLGKLGGPEALDLLLATVRDEKSLARRESIDSLAAFKDPRVVPAVAVVLRDPSHDTRVYAAQTLQKLGYTPESPADQAAYQVALGNMEVAPQFGEAALEPLCTALKSETKGTMNMAAYALGTLGDKRAVEPLAKAMDAQDENDRTQFVEALNSIGGPGVVLPLVKALKNPGFDVRRKASGGLMRHGDERAVPALCDALKDLQLDVVTGAARALEHIGDPRAVEPLCEALNNPEAAVHTPIIQALASLKDPRAVPVLEAYAADTVGSSESQRGNAATALGMLECPEGDAALKRLRDSLPEHDDAREAAEHILSQRTQSPPPPADDPERVDGLLSAVGGEDTAARVKAVEKLAHLRDPRIVPAVAALMKDPAHDVRVVAAQTLKAQGYDPKEPAEEAAYQVALGNLEVAPQFGEAALEPLCTALKSENDETRRMTAFALATLGDRRAVEPLAQAMRGSTPQQQRVFIDTLTTLGGPDVVLPLAEALKNADRNVRTAAARGLGRHGDERAVPALCAALKDLDYDVAEYAAQALGRIGDTRAVTPLCDALRHPGDGVQNEAVLALSMFKDPGSIETLETYAMDFVGHEWSHRRAAVVALGEIETPESRAALERLHESLPSGDTAGKEAANLLSRTAPPSPPVEGAKPRRPVAPPEPAKPPVIGQELGRIIAQLEDEDEWLRKVAVQQIGALEGLTENQRDYVGNVLIKALKDEDQGVSRAAAQVLGTLELPEAIPHLVAALRTTRTRDAAAEALTHFDQPEVMTMLRVAARDDDHNMRHGAIVAASLRRADEAVALLFMAMEKAHSSVIGSAADALAERHRRNPKAVQSSKLVELIKTGDVGVATGAAMAMGLIGEGCSGLLEAAKDPKSPARAAAVEAIGKFPGEGNDAALMGFLSDSDFAVMQAAGKALLSRNVMPENPADRARFYVATQQWDGAAAMGMDAVEPLIMAVVTSDEPLRQISGRRRVGREDQRQTQAANALGKIGDPRAVEPIARLLDDESGEVRSRAAQALYGINDPAVTPVFVKALTNAQEKVRALAAQALGREELVTEDQLGGVVKALCLALRDSQNRVRSSAAESLGKLAEMRKMDSVMEALDALTKALDDTDGEVVSRSIWALAQFGEPAIPVLADFKPDDPSQRHRAFSALGTMGRAAVPTLVAIMKEGTSSDRYAIIPALAQAPTPEAVKAVCTVLQDPDESLKVREQAAGTLNLIGDPDGFTAMAVVLKNAPIEKNPLYFLVARHLVTQSGRHHLQVVREWVAQWDGEDGLPREVQDIRNRLSRMPVVRRPE